MRFRLLLALSLSMTAATARSEPLPISRAYASPALSGPAPRALKVSPDGALVAYLKPEPQDRDMLDLWAAPARGGEAKRLVAGGEVEPRDAVLTEAEMTRRAVQRTLGTHGVTSFEFDDTGRRILIPAGGRLFLYDVDAARLEPLAAAGEGAGDARLTRRGRYALFVRANNLYALDLRSKTLTALTRDGAGTLSYGTAEYVAQEEMQRQTGWWASPDETRVAFTRVDESGVDVIPRPEIGGAGLKLVEQRFPRAGRPNAKVDLFISPISGGAPLAVDYRKDPEDYLVRVDWSKDGRTLYVQRQSRDQTRLDLLAVDPGTARARVLLTEARQPWVNINDAFTPLKSGGFIWGSERTGFLHLYLYDADGRLVRHLTEGAWPVARDGIGRASSPVAGVDEAHGRVFFLASAESPLTRDLYEASLAGTAPPRRITSGNGWWSAAMNKEATVFIGSYSDPDTPPQTAVYDADGRRLWWVEENRLDSSHPFWPYRDHRPEPEYGTLKAVDGQTLHYVLYKPYGFDPAKTYPAVIHVYGGPDSRQVVRAWGGPETQILTQAGFVVFTLDNRGATNQGLAFEAPLHKALGGVEVVDQLQGKRWLEAQTFVDPRRIAVEGWSYGGYMALRLLTEPGAGFAAGVSGAPPTDWRLYDSHYTERYMGDPRTDAAAYDRAAILPRLGVLARPGSPRLLLMQGLEDDNVPIENSLKVMAALQASATPYDLMFLPGERHGPADPSARTLRERVTLEFLQRRLKPAPAPGGLAPEDAPTE